MGSEKGDAVVINAQFVAAGIHIHSWLRHEIAKIGFAHGGEEDNFIVITAGDAFP
jgi:hypothetical protein